MTSSSDGAAAPPAGRATFSRLHLLLVVDLYDKLLALAEMDPTKKINNMQKSENDRKSSNGKKQKIC